MPWMWDHKSYQGDTRREAMIGFFYPEDVENIKQIDHYKIEGHNRRATAAAQKR